MTSDEIKLEVEGCRGNAILAAKSGAKETAWKNLRDAPLWEIAFQLARMNEKPVRCILCEKVAEVICEECRSDKLADHPAGKGAADRERGGCPQCGAPLEIVMHGSDEASVACLSDTCLWAWCGARFPGSRGSVPTVRDADRERGDSSACSSERALEMQMLARKIVAEARSPGSDAEKSVAIALLLRRTFRLGVFAEPPSATSPTPSKHVYDKTQEQS